MSDAAVTSAIFMTENGSLHLLQNSAKKSAAAPRLSVLLLPSEKGQHEFTYRNVLIIVPERIEYDVDLLRRR